MGKNWAVVQFKDEDHSISTVPMSWLKNVNGLIMCFWPNSNQRKHIYNATEPDNSWKSYEVLRTLEECDEYKQALAFEKVKEAESASEAEPFFSRSGRKAKKRKNCDYEYSVKGYLSSPPQLSETDLSEPDFGSFDEDATQSLILIPSPQVLKKTQKKVSDIQKLNREKIEMVVEHCRIPDKLHQVREENKNVNEDNVCDNSLAHNGNNSQPEITRVESQNSPSEVCCVHSNLIKKIYEECLSIRTLLREQQNSLEKVVTPNVFSEKIDTFDTVPVQPYKKYAKLLEYEQTLKESEQARKQLETLFYLCGGQNMRESIRRGLAKVFSDRLAKKCSLTGRKGNHAVQQLKIISLLKVATRKRYADQATEKEFEMNVSAWFRQSQQRYDRRNGHKQE